jgi:hypothetical protein
MLQKHSQINLDDYMKNATKTFQNFVKSAVEKEMGSSQYSKSIFCNPSL